MKIKLFVALFATVFGVSVFAAPQITEEKAKAYAEISQKLLTRLE